MTQAILQAPEMREQSRAKPLRILFAVNTPWTEELGLPRVSIELSRVLAGLGHHVEHFCIDHVRPRVNSKIGGIFALPLFQRALRRHIRQHGHRFDVIQAEHDTLVFPRRSYRFDGLLIAKSNGLRHFYEAYVNGTELALKTAHGCRGTLIGNMLRRASQRLAGGLSGAANRSFATADQIHLLNSDEMEHVGTVLGHKPKCFCIGNGLSDKMANRLAAVAGAESRATSKTVAFVGTWSLRKGKLTLPSVFRQVRSRLPSARLKLLGTQASDEEVLSAFSPEDRIAVTNVAQFAPETLAQLLTDVRVGLFLSYVEGSPLGVLELMAAGLPVVAWNTVGTRNLYTEGSKDLFSAGDSVGPAERLVQYMNLGDAEYREVSQVTLERASTHRWDRIVWTFLDAVEKGLVLQRGRGQ